MKAKQWRNQSNNQSNTMESPQNRLCNPHGSRIVFQSFAFRLFFLLVTFRECKLTPDAQRRPTVDMKGIPQEFRWFDVIMEAWGPLFWWPYFHGPLGLFHPQQTLHKTVVWAAHLFPTLLTLLGVPRRFPWTPPDQKLGGGNSNMFIFTPTVLPGEMIQFDDRLFHMGWFNHQPDVYIYIYTPPNGWCLNAKGVLNGTLSHPVSGILRHDLEDEPYTTLLAVSSNFSRDGLGMEPWRVNETVFLTKWPVFFGNNILLKTVGMLQKNDMFGA